MVWKTSALTAFVAAACFAAAQQPSPSAQAPQQSAATQGQPQKASSAPTHPPAAFGMHVIAYLQARKQNAGTMPKPTANASKLKETRTHMQTRIEQNRADAKQGDIFDPQISDYFRKQISTALNGPGGKRVMASLRRAEPVKQANVAINKPYPSGVPLQSMPPTLLMVLPQLPKELEYRIVGRNLVLLDTEPNLVVDILPNAIPAIPAA